MLCIKPTEMDTLLATLPSQVDLEPDWEPTGWGDEMECKEEDCEVHVGKWSIFFDLTGHQWGTDTPATYLQPAERTVHSTDYELLGFSLFTDYGEEVSLTDEQYKQIEDKIIQSI